MHVLYVSDAAPDDYVVSALREAGHVVEVSADPADGALMAADDVYETIVLDWRRPPQDWIGRFAISPALIVVLASAGDGRERARALRAGADACFVRPFAYAELEARLQALQRTTRRHGRPADAPEIRLVAAERAVRSKDAQVILSALEFRMLEQLLAHPGEVIGVQVLRRLVWGDDAEPAAEPVHRCAARLRLKLASISASGSIEAVPGHGYVLRHGTPGRAQI